MGQSAQHSETGLQSPPVRAIYADPLLGVGPGNYESVPLRRVSQASFPFPVSQDAEFNLQAWGPRAAGGLG